MNKKLKKGLTVAMCALLSVTVITGCGGGETVDPSGGDDTTTTKTYDADTRPFTMAIGAIDGNFNPFFYTAQNDGEVAALTQVSLLSTDASGNITCGEDVPTVAKDYTYKTTNDSSSSTGQITTYQFLIKNGMKDSQGYDLTVMDVLFSMYVTLDVAYTGSLTLYSTDIQGLKAYRAQDPELSDDSDNDYTSTFTTQGQQRIDAIISALDGSGGTKTSQVEEDIDTVMELFLEEITSDWTTIESSFSSSYTEDSFEYNFGEGEAWKYYYLNEGLISILTYTNANGATEYVKDANGKYLTTLDYHATYNTNPSDLEEEMEDALTESNIQAAMTKYGTTDRDEAIEYVKRDTAIQTVYNTYDNDDGVVSILSYWATADTALEAFAGDARTQYYSDLKSQYGGLRVDSVSGITVKRVSQWTDQDGNTIDLDDEYDVLQIVINDIDPKAIYNFAVTVCPMHYYSDSEHYEAAMADYDEYLTTGDGSCITHFGVELGDSDFFEDVLQDSDKNRNPVGAGSYATSNINGGTGSSSTFYTNKYVYYVRNEYFETMGEGINNAIIKYVRYREMGDDKIINSLAAKEVDYGMPSATADNAKIMSAYQDYLDYTTALYDTSGYGYVGINPKFVEDYRVRIAIMKAMNTASIVSNYYTKYYASTIYRPMSKTSWAYDNSWGEYYAYTTNTDDIIELIEEAGYTYTTGKKNAQGVDIRCNSSGDSLTYTFTIAGESTDHPAYNMFLDAEEFLEKCGFDITVTTNINALKELNSGNLAVWAAAWTSSVDPDMYQVYHKDSTASSVKNWNYTNILKNPSDWSYEYEIIQELSDLIDDGRATNDQDERKAIYSDALKLVMDLAVELPTYQRKDNEVFNYTVLDKNSLTAKPSTYVSLIERIWEIDYV